LVKRYVAERGSDTVVDAMKRADGWFICRAGFVETVRAVGLAAGHRATTANHGRVARLRHRRS
jgi:hypothetical protein